MKRKKRKEKGKRKMGVLIEQNPLRIRDKKVLSQIAKAQKQASTSG